MMKRILNIYSSFNLFGGAELILLTLTEGLNKITNLKVYNYSFYYRKINGNYNESTRIYFLNFKDVFINSSNTVFLSHHRKITSILYLIRKIFLLKYDLIHVAHNEFYSFQKFTFLPQKIIAVSERVKKNLIDYFAVHEQNITVIYNGIKDLNPGGNLYVPIADEKIKILYPARITKIKNQINLVKALKKQQEKIKIYFAGDGPLLKELKSLCHNNDAFIILGHTSKISELYMNLDYVMLFSKNEGLPTVLIEAFMYGKPVICNNVGGNAEIVDHGINGLICEKMDDLTKLIVSLPKPGSGEYQKLCVNARNKYEQVFKLESMINNYKDYLAKNI